MVPDQVLFGLIVGIILGPLNKLPNIYAKMSLSEVRIKIKKNILKLDL